MISVTVLTKNSQKYIEKVLESLKPFDEVIVFDSGSKDQTLEIASKFFNVSIHQGEFIGFGPTHNLASSFAKHDWILSIDSDEMVLPDLASEILSIPLNEQCVYSIQRNNYFNGKWIRWCGWYPERVHRLYHRQKTRFCDSLVHESVLLGNMVQIPLKGTVQHYPYENIADFLKKMESYTELFAQQNKRKRKSSLGRAIWHSFYAFFKSYLMKRGFLGGYEGFLISVYNANTAFYKYLKLMEYNKK